MAQPQPKPRFTAAEYLAWEATQTERHEYIDGEVFAMSGADGLWVLHPFSGDQAVELASVALTVPAEALFADLEGETPAGPPPA